MAKPPPLVVAPSGEQPLDRALGLAASGDIEPTCRLAVPLVKADLAAAGPLFVLGHMLRTLGQSPLATVALEAAADRAADSGNLPMALAAVAELFAMGADPSERADAIAKAYAKGSTQLKLGGASLPPPAPSEVQALPAATAGAALVEAAVQVVEYARASLDGDRQKQKAPPALPAQGLFSSLSAPALRELMGAFEVRILRKDEK